MKFLLYDYVLSQISQAKLRPLDIWLAHSFLTGFFAAKAHRNKHDKVNSRIVYYLHF